MKFRSDYALATLVLFLTELGIALFVHDSFVRPHLGDTLAVILIYLAIRTVMPWRVIPAVAAALAFAVVIEIGQAFHLISRLHLDHNQIAHFVLGSGFDRKDFVAYAAGGIIVIVVEALRKERLL